MKRSGNSASVPVLNEGEGIMKNTTVKNALLGIAIALVAAYFFTVVFFTFIMGMRGMRALFSLIPLIGLLYTFWVVIPLGAALGMLIPKMVYGKSRWMAALQGAGLGAVSGLISFLCLDSVYELGMSEVPILLLAMAYSALWVGAYACWRAKGQSLYK